MSVLIKGMKKPDNCEICPYAFCHLDTKNCPIIELPDHGDLIDRDEIFMQLRTDMAVIERMASEARAMSKDYLDGEMTGMGKAMIRVYEHEAVIPAERRKE